MTIQFKDMGVNPTLLASLTRLNFASPTPIQQGAIPPALTGKDIIGSAQTGTGKTFAYGIPVVQGLIDNPESTALILTPTRELATQVLDSMRKLLDGSLNIKTALLIGGDPYTKQFSQLRAKARLVVGTPGRVIDHLSQKTYIGKDVRYLVLDETDRMFDMGFGIQLAEILKFVPKERQTLMFSATFPPKVDELASKYLSNPVKVFLESNKVPTDRLKQESLKLKEGEKYDTLVRNLNERDGSVIIFVKTKSSAEDLARELRVENLRASAIHGDLKQRKRDLVIKDFRSGRATIMVATDIAARGLDIPHVQHVINYDLPTCPEDYIHRIGRTARAGAEGCALSFIAPHDARKWDAIQRLMYPEQFKGSGRSEGGSGERSSNGNGGKSRFGGGKPGFGKSGFGKSSDRPQGGSSRFKSKDERPSFGGQKSERSDRPAFGDRPSFGGQRSERSDRPAFGDRPSFGGQKSERSDRPAFGDRPSFGQKSDRPAFGGGRGKPSGGKPGGFGGKPGGFGGKPSFGGGKKFGGKSKQSFAD